MAGPGRAALPRTRGELAARYGELAARYGAMEADPHTAPFLKLLWDEGLIDCDTNPNNSTLPTRIKIQKLVYLAQRRFKLDFRYSHTMYIYGPYSVGLANDYFRLQDICSMPGGGLEGWGRKAEFLDFARAHNDVKWLEIACTLIFAHDVSLKGRREDLLAHVQKIKRGFRKEYIAQVHGELARSGLLAG